ncbi:unnamed protein product, partial [Discosporangium mesarthrocarpum]
MNPNARKVAVGAVAALIVAKSAASAWTRFENSRLTLNIKRLLVSPELEDSLKSIREVMSAFEQDIRTDMKRSTERVPSLVNLLILNTIHEREAAARDCREARMLQESEARSHDEYEKEGRNGKDAKDAKNRWIQHGVDEKVGKEAARYVRFAISAYGVLMLKARAALGASRAVYSADTQYSTVQYSTVQCSAVSSSQRSTLLGSPHPSRARYHEEELARGGVFFFFRPLRPPPPPERERGKRAGGRMAPG